jgi:hypothetical protein
VTEANGWLTGGLIPRDSLRLWWDRNALALPNRSAGVEYLAEQ